MLVSRLTLTNDLNLGMGGSGPFLKHPQDTIPTVRMQSARLVLMSIISLKSHTSLGPSFIFHFGPEASIWDLSVLYVPGLPEHMTESRWQNPSHSLHSELTGHLFPQINYSITFHLNLLEFQYMDKM